MPLNASNEGERLEKTVRSVVEASRGLNVEIVVADDASWDGSVEAVRKRFPRVQLVRSETRQGASATKDMGARASTGQVLVFLDGHTNPEPGALRRLADDVELVEGKAIVTPAVTSLDPRRWRNTSRQIGQGYYLVLADLSCGWLPLAELRRVQHGPRVFYESPAAIGCAVAVPRDL